MSEAGSKSNLIKKLKPLDALPIEHKFRVGIADVECIGAWIECKWMRSWPKNCDTSPVKFPHPLLKEQGIRARNRWKAGGLHMVCVQVGREWFFFSGLDIKDHFDKMTRPQMREKAILYFDKGLDRDRLIGFILQTSQDMLKDKFPEYL